MANKVQRCLRQWLLVALLCGAWPVAAQCLAPLMPDDGDAYAYSPFGVDRTGRSSKGWHLGLDIQKPVNTRGGGGKKTPLSAPFTGTVYAAANLKGAGNMLVFERPDGMKVQYMHMHNFADKFRSTKPVPVVAGEFVGLMGGTGGPYAVHLHLGTLIPANSSGNYRDKMFAQVRGAKSTSNRPFTADMLASGYKPKSSMAYVDPQYWLNRQYPWRDTSGNVQNLVKNYGKYGFKMAPGNKTFPPTCPALGSFDYSQLAKQQAVQAVGGEDPSNMTPEQMEASTVFQDGDRLGIVDAPPFESYADLSEKELIRIEAGRRMTDAGWDQQVAESSIRGLTIEIARIRAADLYIQQRLEEKKKRVESLAAALLAVRAGKR